MLARVAAVKKKLGSGLEAILRSYGVEWRRGTGRLRGPGRVEIFSDGGSEEVAVKKILIACGTRPLPPERVLPEISARMPAGSVQTVEEACADPFRGGRPSRVAIVGAGPSGLEFASFYASVGCEVTVVEKEPEILPAEDPEAAAGLRRYLERKGIRFLLGQKPAALEGKADKLILAAGREPATEGVDATGKLAGPGGWIRTDAFLRTKAAGVFAAGEVTGGVRSAYAAYEQGMLAAENGFGKKARWDPAGCPEVVFTEPAYASVGGKAAGRRVRVEMAANPMASILRQMDGFVEIVLDRRNRILAARICSPLAYEMIHPLAIAVRLKLRPEDLPRHLFVHPSLSEAIGAAVSLAAGRSIDLPKR